MTQRRPVEKIRPHSDTSARPADPDATRAHLVEFEHAAKSSPSRDDISIVARPVFAEAERTSRNRVSLGSLGRRHAGVGSQVIPITEEFPAVRQSRLPERGKVLGGCAALALALAGGTAIGVSMSGTDKPINQWSLVPGSGSVKDRSPGQPQTGTTPSSRGNSRSNHENDSTDSRGNNPDTGTSSADSQLGVKPNGPDTTTERKSSSNSDDGPRKKKKKGNRGKGESSEPVAPAPVAVVPVETTDANAAATSEPVAATPALVAASSPAATPEVAAANAPIATTPPQPAPQSDITSAPPESGTAYTPDIIGAPGEAPPRNP